MRSPDWDTEHERLGEDEYEYNDLQYSHISLRCNGIGIWSMSGCRWGMRIISRSIGKLGIYTEIEYTHAGKLLRRTPYLRGYWHNKTRSNQTLKR